MSKRLFPAPKGLSSAHLTLKRQAQRIKSTKVDSRREQVGFWRARIKANNLLAFQWREHYRPCSVHFSGLRSLSLGLKSQALLILFLVLLLTGCAASATPTVLPAQADLGKWNVVYLYRDEAVEANQAYQLSAFSTAADQGQPRPLHRFPIDAIAVPWDVRPPSAISPDGKTLAMVQWDEKQGGALTVNLATGEMKPLPGIDVKGLFDTTILGWTPDGARLIIYYAGLKNGRVLSYDLAKSTLTDLFTLDDVIPTIGQETLSPDSSRLLYCNVQGNRGCGGYAMRLIDSSKGGSTAKNFKLPPKTVCGGYPALKWSPDSRRIALSCIAGSSTSLTMLDATTGDVSTYPTSMEVNDMAWSPDSTRLMIDLCAGDYVNADDGDCGALQFMDAATGALTPGPKVERTEARRLYWLDNTIVFNESSGGGQEATLYFYDVPSRQSKQFTRNSSSYQDAGFTILGMFKP